MKFTNHNLSIQGTPGIIFGVISIVTIYFSNSFIQDFVTGVEGISFLPITFFEIIIGAIAFLYIVISYVVVVLINKFRRRKNNFYGWTPGAKKIRYVFLILLILGGLLCYFFEKNGLVKLIIPIVLLLFGTGCILVKNLTNGPSSILGIFFIIQSILTIINPVNSFLYFGIAFGIYIPIYSIGYTFLKNVI